MISKEEVTLPWSGPLNPVWLAPLEQKVGRDTLKQRHRVEGHVGTEVVIGVESINQGTAMITGNNTN